jgi:aspartate/methionine/tyrosine aminotransferase
MNSHPPVPFSRRTAWERTPNRLADAWARRLASGKPSIDLTESNPTRCGFTYPEARILQALADPRGLVYGPAPRGLPAAREAVARYLAAEVPGAAPCSPDDLVLCASTSEAYGWLMKLLCERGDQVLVPRPSYPLFDFLAGLEEVTLVPYSLRREERWRVDFASLAAAASPRTRAVIVVHPNNPTGNTLTVAEADATAGFCAERGLAIISDEVFLEYPFPPAQDVASSLVGGPAVTESGPDSAAESIAGSPATARAGCLAGSVAGPIDGSPATALSGSLARRGGCLVFSLGGLSKSSGLPQIKVGWIRVGGPAELATEAMARLEVIADTYLSVNTPAQWALPELLAAGRDVRDAIRARTTANLRWLESKARDVAWELLPADGGWYAVLRVPRTHTEEEWCLLLAEEEGVLLHPGFFFDFESEAFLVASLLPEEGRFAEAMTGVLGRLG